jgi:hypothetical protein
MNGQRRIPRGDLRYKHLVAWVRTEWLVFANRHVAVRSPATEKMGLERGLTTHFSRD